MLKIRPIRPWLLAALCLPGRAAASDMVLFNDLARTMGKAGLH